ncbi:MAG: cobalt-precorrin-6A reductase [Alphaproteobacteria bacterium]|nr:cobalt-precorrin-6A reductase [Alphaproteobacteria bacterium]
MERLLILGGTREAAQLARAAARRFGDALQVTTSLAGRTERPAPLPGNMRIGGFGGAAGLYDYLTEHRIDRVVDATHPFATRISTAARVACEQANIPRLILQRPPWRRHALDHWIEVDDSVGAASIVRHNGHRVWLTVGKAEIAAFSGMPAVHFLVRVVDPPRRRLPLLSYEVIASRGPFSLPEERRHIEHHAIDMLVCKASGGAATEAKIVAARERGLPVVMVRRPPAEPGEAVETVGATLEWLVGGIGSSEQSECHENSPD